MAVSLKDIAQSAGVSIGAVSRILRGDPKFSKDTAEKVARIAKEMGYRPNKLVQGMRTGRTQTIGVMVPTRAEFLARMVCGIHHKLAVEGYTPILLWSEPGLPELEQIHRLVDRRVDGMILFPSEDAAPDTYFNEVWEREIPLVTVDRKMLYTHADFVGTDDHLGGVLAAQHLLDLGHRNVAHLGAVPTISTSRERGNGFKETIASVQGARVADVMIEDRNDGFDAALKMLRSPARPSAVFTGSDLLAVNVLQAARSLGISVPDQLSVVGFAGLAVGEACHPPLTTLRQNPEEIGKIAAQTVLDRIDGRLTSKEPHRVALTPELVVRGSTGVFAGE